MAGADLFELPPRSSAQELAERSSPAIAFAQRDLERAVGDHSRAFLVDSQSVEASTSDIGFTMQAFASGDRDEWRSAVIEGSPDNDRNVDSNDLETVSSQNNIDGGVQQSDRVLSVETDQDDYAPGETATIVATGLPMGATVQFEIDHVAGTGDDGIFGTLDDSVVQLGGRGHDPWIVTDGGTGDRDGTIDGSITTSWHVNPDDSLNERFLLTATDNATKQVASTTFTDSPTIIDVGISASADDVEERQSGSVKFTSSDLELVDDLPNRPNQTVGLRFNQLDIPQGAVITAAYINFQVDEVSTGTATLEIFGEDVDNASAFIDTAFNVSSRQRTDVSVTWSPDEWLTKGSAEQTDDISAVIQEIVSRPGWTANNSLALIFTGGGTRTAESFDGAAAPILHVEWVLASGQPPTSVELTGTTVVENSPAAAVIGLFENVVDPDVGDTHAFTLTDDAGGRFQIVGSELQVADSSLLDFEDGFSHDIMVRVTDSGGQFLDQSFTITVDDINEAPELVSPIADTFALQDQAFSFLVSSNFADDDTSHGDTLTLDGTLVGGGALPSWLNFDGTTGSFTGTPAAADLGTYDVAVTATDSFGPLSVSDSFTIDVVNNPPMPQIVATAISNSTDDVEERQSGSVKFTSSDLELVDDLPNRPNQTVGLRFNQLDIPQGAVITAAYIQFKVDEVSTGTATLEIFGEDVDNAPAFSSTTFNVSSRQKTDASVTWLPPDWLTKGSDQQTDDISTIIQEIVARPGWTTNNSIVLIVDGSGARTAESFDGTAAPILHIEFQPPGPQSEPVAFDVPADIDPAADEIGELSAAGTAVGITASATDPDTGDTVTYSVDDPRFTIDSGGVIARSGTGTLDFETEPTINFTVTATSSDFSTDTHLFTIAVNDGDEIPIAVDDSAVTQSDTPIVIDALANDDLGDGLATITSAAVSLEGGTVVNNGDGTFDYTPPSGYAGPDSFAYTITDTSNDNSTATVSVTVAPTPLFRFAAFGDFGDADLSGEQAVSDLVHGWNVDFILTTGDNAYGAVTYDQSVGQFYSDYLGDSTGSVINRFFPILGNHDYEDPGAGLAAYLAYFNLPDNERYYDFQAGSVHFFGLNSYSGEPDGNNVGQPQAQWLESALAASDAAFNVVYFHDTAFTSDGGGDLDMRWPYEAWGADATFAGDVHDFDLVVRDDNGDGVALPYVTSGRGGSGTSPPSAGANLVTVTDVGMFIDYYTVDGALWGQHFVDLPAGVDPQQFANGNDIINGTADHDYLWGLGGNDTLKGLGGNDMLIGGVGDDLFIIGINDGQDTIADFVPGAGTTDKLDLTALGIGTASAFQQVAVNQGSNVVVDFGGSNQITLLGVQVEQFHDDDFVSGPINQPVAFDIPPDADLAANQIVELAAAGQAVGITASASDPNPGDTVTYSVDDPRFAIAANGIVTRSSIGALDFETEPTIALTVTATSSDLSTATQPFSITVNDDNELPVANDDSATTQTDTAIVIDALANDDQGDGLATITSDTASLQGGAVVNNGDGTFDYTPPSGYAGGDSFTYTISDINGPETSTATVAISIAPLQPPSTVTLQQSINIGESGLWWPASYSPDPAGIVHIDHGSYDFLISDSEVNEMPIYQNENLFFVDELGGLSETATTFPDFSDEPTGVTYNPSNLHLFFSDDTSAGNGKRIYEVDPGPDGLYFTADDPAVGSFRTSDFGSSDPEGVAYDTMRDILYVLDGASDTAFRVDPGPDGSFVDDADNIVSSFGTSGLGVVDPEGIAYDEVFDLIYIIGRKSDDTVQQVDPVTGALVGEIDISAANAKSGAGLAIGPSSVAGLTSLWIVDRGVDNNSNPSENDGKVYEFSFDLVV